MIKAVLQKLKTSAHQKTCEENKMSQLEINYLQNMRQRTLVWDIDTLWLTKKHMKTF